MRQRVMVRVLVAVLGAGLLAALGACGGGASSASAPSGSASPTRGGTLVVTFQAEPVTLDPAIDFEGPGWAIEHCIFGNLLNYSSGPGSAGTKIVPDMATVVPTVANGGITNGGKTYIFHIRPGIKFAPPVNREVTAADFVYSFQRMMSLPTAPAKGYYAGIVGLQAFLNGKAKTIAGYKATGKYTLEVDLEQPIATVLNIMEMPFSAPVAKEWVARWGKLVGRHPLGTGPYVAAHWTASQDLLLTRNTNYTGTSGYVDAMQFDFSITPTTAVLKVQSGDADLLGDYIPPANFPSLSVNPTWKSQVVVEPAVALNCLFFNDTVKPFDNVAVRQALSWAIDRAKIVKLLSGTGLPLNQIYPAGLPGHVDGAAGDFYGYDAAKAKQLLAAAGYPNGFSTTLYSSNVAPLADAAAVDPVRLRADRREGEHQAARPVVVLDADRQEGRRRDGPEQLVDGLPRPVRLYQRHAQQELGDRRGQQPELLVGPQDREGPAAGAGDARPGRSPGEVRPDAVVYHEPGPAGAALPVRGHHAALQAHRRHLPAPGVDLRLPALLDRQVTAATGDAAP